MPFLNSSTTASMGSVFTRYKTPALVNLDWTTTFPPTGMRKDMDLGLSIARELGMPMPVTAADPGGAPVAFRRRPLQPDPARTTFRRTFAALLETLALFAARQTRERKRCGLGRARTGESSCPKPSVELTPVKQRRCKRSSQ